MKRLFNYLLPLMLTLTTPLLAEHGEELPPVGQGMMQTLIMIGIMVAIFYLILWRPEQKRRKALETQRAGLKKGDRVTAMGIIGVVVKVEEHTVVLRMIDGAKIEFLKAAVTEVMPTAEEEPKEEK